MILDEHFYVSLCFFVVLVLVYKKTKIFLEQFLDGQIAQITFRVTEAQDLKSQAVEALQDARSNLAEIFLMKEKKINQARVEASGYFEAHRSQVDANIAIMRAEQDRYFANLQEEFLRKNKLKVLDLASKQIIQEVQDKKISFEATLH